MKTRTCSRSRSPDTLTSYFLSSACRCAFSRAMRLAVSARLGLLLAMSTVDIRRPLPLQERRGPRASACSEACARARARDRETETAQAGGARRASIALWRRWRARGWLSSAREDPGPGRDAALRTLPAGRGCRARKRAAGWSEGATAGRGRKGWRRTYCAAIDGAGGTAGEISSCSSGSCSGSGSGSIRCRRSSAYRIPCRTLYRLSARLGRDVIR